MKKKLFIHYINFRKLIRVSALVILITWCRIYSGFLNTPLLLYNKLYALVQTYYHHALAQTYYNRVLTYNFTYGSALDKLSYPATSIQLDSLKIRRVHNSNLQYEKWLQNIQYERLLQENLQNVEYILQFKLARSKTKFETIKVPLSEPVPQKKTVPEPTKVKRKKTVYTHKIGSPYSKHLHFYLRSKPIIFEPTPALAMQIKSRNSEPVPDLMLQSDLNTQVQFKQQLCILPSSSFSRQPYSILIINSPIIGIKLRSSLCPTCGKPT